MLEGLPKESPLVPFWVSSCMDPDYAQRTEADKELQWKLSVGSFWGSELSDGWICGGIVHGKRTLNPKPLACVSTLVPRDPNIP